jgi:mannose-1-phosphate guanylyltransferase/mannose-6-phosphate isomerase
MLAGGIGSRLWPLSRSSRPKQFLPLIDETSLFQKTVQRLTSVSAQPPLIITNEEHRFLAAEQLRELNLPYSKIVLEPVGRNTAAAAAIAAFQIVESDPTGLMLLTPSDHAISNEAAFCDAVAIARENSHQADYFLFGITPEQPVSGFGYINAPGGGGTNLSSCNPLC